MDRLQEVTDLALVCGDDAFDEGSAGAGTARDQYLAVQSRGDCLNVRQGGETVHQWAPVADAVSCSAHEVDVGGGTDQALLQVTPHSVGDRQRDDERSDASCDSDDRDRSDEPDNRLAATRAEIAGGDEEFKTHASFSGGLWSGL